MRRQQQQQQQGLLLHNWHSAEQIALSQIILSHDEVLPHTAASREADSLHVWEDEGCFQGDKHTMASVFFILAPIKTDDKLGPAFLSSSFL